MSTEIQHHDDRTPTAGPRGTALVIDDAQNDFTDAQLAALQHMGIQDAPAGDRQVFFHQCKRTGLDPFSKQIYMIGRAKKKKVGNQWVDDGFTYTIQIGIDGYRVMGNRIATLAGDTLHIGKTEWAGRDGVWRDMWLDSDNPPLAARAKIVKNGNTIESTAMYHEYVQTKFNGDPNSMWAKMPANQLAKCAEAAVWRKAYPTDFSGLVLEDAAQVIDGTVEATRPAPARPPRVEAVNDLRANLAAASAQPADPAQNVARGARAQAETTGTGTEQSGTEQTVIDVDGGVEMASQRQIATLNGLLDKEGFPKTKEGIAERLEWLRGNLQRDDIQTPRDLTAAEAADLIGYLEKEQAKDAATASASDSTTTTTTTKEK